MKTVLIIGASRGVGLGLTEAYAKNNEFDVYVTCRANEGELKNVENITILKNIDIGSDEVIEKLKSDNVLPQRLDLVICNAGMKDSSQELHNLSKTDSMINEYNVNALGPLRVAKGLENRLVKNSKLAFIGSMLASVSLVQDNSPEMYLGYRMSKSGLNMAGKMLAVNWRDRGVLVGMFNPGVIQTEMSGFIGMPIETSVDQLVLNFEKLNAGNSGRVFNLFPGLLPYNGTGPFLGCFPELEENGSDYLPW